MGGGGGSHPGDGRRDDDPVSVPRGQLVTQNSQGEPRAAVAVAAKSGSVRPGSGRSLPAGRLLPTPPAAGVSAEPQPHSTTSEPQEKAGDPMHPRGGCFQRVSLPGWVPGPSPTCSSTRCAGVPSACGQQTREPTWTDVGRIQHTQGLAPPPPPPRSLTARRPPGLTAGRALTHRWPVSAQLPGARSGQQLHKCPLTS